MIYELHWIVKQELFHILSRVVKWFIWPLLNDSQHWNEVRLKVCKHLIRAGFSSVLSCIFMNSILWVIIYPLILSRWLLGLFLSTYCESGPKSHQSRELRATDRVRRRWTWYPTIFAITHTKYLFYHKITQILCYQAVLGIFTKWA